MNTCNTKTARAQALALNEKTFQGVPCKRGHDGVRYTRTRRCVMCKREWGAAHTEQKSATDAVWRDAHVEQQKATRAAWYAAHTEQHNATCAAWKAANPGAVRASHSKRRVMELQQRCSRSCCSDVAIAEFHKQAALCGRFAHVDHKIQLALGGHDCAKNLVALTVEEHKVKTRLDAAARAESRRRNKLLRNWLGPGIQQLRCDAVSPIQNQLPGRIVYGDVLDALTQCRVRGGDLAGVLLEPAQAVA